MSLWTMGFNQHTRGTWVNNMVYNVHLLTGKIATPGNSPFSLTGQPSACGTARRWARSRTACRPTWWSPTPSTARSRAHLEAAARHHPRQARLPRRAAEPHAQGRQAQCLLGAGQQQHAGGANMMQETCPATAIRQLHRRLRRLPDGHGAGRRPDPAHRHVGEKEGAYGNAERRTQFWHQLVKAPGEALRPVAVDGVLQALQGRGRLAGGADRQEARVQGQDAVRRAVRNGKVDKFPLKETASDYNNDESKAFGFYVQKGLFEEYATSAAAMATTWRRSTPTTRRAACAGRWSTARKRAGAIAKARPVREGGHASSSTATRTARP
jgi:nitrate reductase NapA